MVEGKEFYRESVKGALSKLNSSQEGLKREEAKGRLEEYGKNELESGKSISRWWMFLSQFKKLLVMVLLVAGVLSFLIGSYRNAGAMLAIVVINAIIGFVQEHKAEKVVDKLKNLIKSPAKVIREGEIGKIPQEELVPGDIIKVEEGDKIPADIRIIEEKNFRTNDFSLTGESMPQGKHNKAIDEKAGISDRENMAFLGTTVASGSAKGLVVATGMDTEMGKISGMTEETGKIKSPMKEELDVLAKKLTGIVIVISIMLFFITQYQGLNSHTGLVIALGIAVSSVPQALPAQVTVALSTGSKRLADKKGVIKNLPSVETLGSTTVICTDKTGTLTKNEMTVKSVWFDEEFFEVTGLGYEPEGEMIRDNGEPVEEEDIQRMDFMFRAATMASEGDIHPPDENNPNWYPMGDPTEAALVTLSEKMGVHSPEEDEKVPELKQFPFDSERKRMSSLREFQDRDVVTIKGAVESILSISKYIYKNGEVREITEKDKERIREVNEKFSKEALRVLAIAHRPLDSDMRDGDIEEMERDAIFLSLMGMRDPPKEGVEEAIQAAHKAHIKTFMVTGDHATTARAVGEEIGISESDDPPILTGKDLYKMDDQELTKFMGEKESIIFSRVDPKQKLRIVKLLEENDEVVAVTGDGINDAPALKKAHIGVSMGQTGTDVAKESSQLVLLDDNFSTLVDAVREGRTIYNNIKKIVLSSMTTNGAELATVLLGLLGVALFGWAIPILVIQILAIDLLAELLPLTFLTFDPPSKEIMSSPPRKESEHLINKFDAIEVLFFGFLIGLLAFGNYVFFMFREGVFFLGDKVKSLLYSRATTSAYLTIAYCQFVNILSRRHELTSIFSRKSLTNKILLWSVVFSIGMVFFGVYGPFLSDILMFGPPTLTDWIYVWGASGIFLFGFETLKAFKRRKG
ncbi:MAG: cation-translocating P-type ATPase [Candidatus Aenigmatarchaeota archaeon]